MIELLAVIGAIAMFAGVLGFALHDRSNQSVALQSAQHELAGQVAAARALAALHQAPARLLIYAREPPAGDAGMYLHSLQLAREYPSGSAQWVAVGTPVILPRNIFVVPPDIPNTHLAAGIIWPDGNDAPVSTLTGPCATALNGHDFGAAYFVEFTPQGKSDPSITKLVIATAQSTPNAPPRFDNPATVRGILLRAGGAVSLAHNAPDF